MKDTAVSIITNLQEESFWLGMFCGLLVALLFSILYTWVGLYFDNRKLRRQESARHKYAPLAQEAPRDTTPPPVAHGSTKATLNPATGRMETAQFAEVATEPRHAVRPTLTPEHEVTR